MAALEQIMNYIETNKTSFISNLAKVVSTKNVSSWCNQRAYYKQCGLMIDLINAKLRKLKFQTRLGDTGVIEMEDGTEAPRPPVILAELGKSPDKKTLLIYGHLDVQPARLTDGWDSEPFQLRNDGENLYGRGATDDKGPVMGWLNCLEAFAKKKVDLPVNIKMVLESQEEVGSEGLKDLLEAEKNCFLKDVDFVAISDNYWIGKEDPCLTYGLRGIVYFHVEVECAARDLHSGVYGGAFYEAMPDLIYLMSQLIDKDGKILIPELDSDVEPLTKEEEELYKGLQFDNKEFQSEVGIKGLRFPRDKAKTLMARWRYPSLSLHGIEGAFSDPGAKTVIPKKVTGKFSIRIVPNQNPVDVKEKVVKYMKGKWKEWGSPNELNILVHHSGRPWKTSYDSVNYEAAANAIEQVYEKKGQFTREGGSIPITLVLEELVGEGKVLLLPMGQSDDGAHSQNEKISIRNYIIGTKVFAAYLLELGRLNSVPGDEEDENMDCECSGSSDDDEDEDMSEDDE